MDKIIAAAGKHAALVENVRFRLRVREEKRRAARKLLVISLHELDAETRAAIREQYLNFSGISFPLKERAKHMMVRIDDRVYNFGRFVFNFLPRFRIRTHKIPSSRTLEVMLALSEEENRLLRVYLGNILKNRARTIGAFHMEGSQFSAGKIDQNRTEAFGHNCTSWLATAPIGGGGKALLEELGGDRELDVGRNPGWWTNWLAATAAPERVPFVIHWTNLPLDAALSAIKPGENLEWDFNKH
jgi:hypothetical protein